MKNRKDAVLLQLFIIYTRYLIGGTFVFASLIKIKGGRFTMASGADAPINSAGHFFETLYQSGLYWQFIGWGQLATGFLLMTQRYAKLGALTFLPIIGNIFVITLSYDFNGTPVITGLLLLANLLLLAWDWDELKILVNAKPVFSDKKRLMHDRIWEVTGLLLFLFTAGYRIWTDAYDIFLWFGICTLIGLAGLLVGWSRKNTYRKFASSN